MAATSGARTSRSAMRASSGVSWVSQIRETCENAVREAGFTEGELPATLGGERLYLATGWRETERTVVPTSSGIDVPAARMVKQILPYAR